MGLHKSRVEKIPLFHLKKCDVNYFCLLPVIFQGQSVWTCALRCIITAYCAYHSLDKHNF